MTGGSLPDQTLAPTGGSKKKIKTILPQKPLSSPVNDESESESSEEEAPGGVIDDIDYESLEDIWLKAGEREAEDLSLSESRRKVKECGTRGRGSTTEEDEACGSPERKRKTHKISKSLKSQRLSKGTENEIEVPLCTNVGVGPRQPVEYILPLANKNLVRPTQPQSQTGKPAPAGFENGLFNFCSKKTDPIGSGQTAPMIRIDYSKQMEEKSPNKSLDLNNKTSAGKSLSSTIEKLKSNLRPGGLSVSSSVTEAVAGRVLALVVEAGMRPQQAVAILQRGWSKTEVSSQALEQVVSEVTQLRQLRTQMSPTHRQLLDQSHCTHRAAALALLSSLPARQLEFLQARLAVSPQSWAASLDHLSSGWRLTVTAPGSASSQSFNLERGQVTDLGLHTFQAPVLSSK